MTLVVSGLEEAGVTQNLYSFTIEINRVYTVYVYINWR